jgi:hypothetical protein
MRCHITGILLSLFLIIIIDSSYEMTVSARGRLVNLWLYKENKLPACQPALQPWVSLVLLYNQSPPGVRFLNKIIFYRMGLLSQCPTPILEDQGVSLSLDSTL